MPVIAMPTLPLSMDIDLISPEEWKRESDAWDNGNISTKGGKGSGNFDHAGRPGKVGGSSNSLLSENTLNYIKESISSDVPEEAWILDRNRPKRSEYPYWYWSGLRPLGIWADKDIPGTIKSSDGRMIYSKKPFSLSLISLLQLIPGHLDAKAQTIIDYSHEMYGGDTIALGNSDFFDEDLGRGYLIHPSTRNKGKWQVTGFSKKIGFTGHNEYNTKFDSVLETIKYDDVTPVDPEYVDDIFSGMTEKGGKGSGNFGHAGRPGKIGGSRITGQNVDIDPFDSVPNNAEIGDLSHDGDQRKPANQTDEVIEIVTGHSVDTNLLQQGLREDQKRKIVNSLSNSEPKCIEPQERANAFLRTWASSSNNGSSIVFQVAAAREFKQDINDWQNEYWGDDRSKTIHNANLVDKIVEYSSNLENIIMMRGEKKIDYDEYVKRRSELDDKYSRLFDETGGITEREVRRTGVLKSKNGLFYPKFGMEECRKLLKLVYDSTQTKFADAGFKPDDYITVFRGMVPETKLKVGDVVGLKGNPLESWSLSSSVAMDFAKYAENGIVLSMRTKIKDIVSLPTTGFGCLPEYEIVIKNSGKIKKSKVVLSYAE